MSKGMIRCFSFVGAVAYLCASLPASAYIPPSQFLIRNWAKKHYGYKHIVIRSTVTAMDNGQPTAVHFRDLTAFYPPTGTLKSWATDDTGVNLFETEQKGAAVSTLAALLFEPNASTITLALKSKGIPVLTDSELDSLTNEDMRRAAEKEFLARWNSTVAWVLGLENRGKTPQLWIEKDTFLPVRLLGQLNPDSSDFQDLQMEGYRYYREFPYPRTIFWMNSSKQPIMKIDMTEIVVDTGSDLSRVRIREGFTEDGNSESGKLRDLIKSYYQVVR